MRTRGLLAPFALLFLASSAWAEAAPHPPPRAAVVAPPRVAPPRTAPTAPAHALAPSEELQTLLPELKAARRELAGGVVTPARRATIEALVTKVRGLATKLPEHDVSGRAKAEFTANGVTAQLDGIAAGTLKPLPPDVDVRTALAPRHAPRVPEKVLRTSLATWARSLPEHANADQPTKVRGLVEALGASGYGATEAMDLLAHVLAEELETKGVSPGGWTQHFVEEQIFRLAGLEGPDARPIGWGHGPAAPAAAHLPLHAGRGDLHPETKRLLGDLGTIAEARARVTRPQLERAASRAGVSRAELDAVRALFRRAPVHVRFRPSATLLDGLEKDPTWKNLHESGTTGGNPDLLNRKTVERNLGFLDDDVPPGERPKYGYLNVTNATEGQAGHYGDAVLVLRQEVKQRATVCFGDSFGGGKWDPAQPVTSFDHPDAAIAPLLRREGIRPLVDVATGRRSSAPYPYPVASDRYLEVQIFGKVDLRRDVQAIVLGPEAAASPERARLVALATRLGIPVHVTPPSGFADIGFTK